MASTNFINECKKRANANRLGKLVIDGAEKPITQSDNLQNFLINDSCYIEGSIIGTIYIKKLTASLVSSNKINLVDKKIDAQIGVKFADNSTEYINMGKYTIERPTDKKTANMSEITAYDSLINKIDDEYICNINYETGNKTLLDLYVDVCNQLELTPKTTTFLNNNIPIFSNPFTNREKNRVVLQTIAKIACSFVVIDNDTNEIDLSWLSESKEPDYIFEKNDYSTLVGGNIVYGPINSVTIKNSTIDDENITETDESSITTNGEHSIIIDEDYILYNEELRKQAITAIFKRLNGLKYVDAEITTYYGKPFLKLGKKIRIMTDNGYIDTYVLMHDFMYDGTFYSVIKSPALTKQEIKNKQSNSLAKAVRDAQVQINKQAGTITNLVSKVEDIEVDTTLTKQVSGNPITIEDAGAYPCESFIVEGKSEQETRSDKNLFIYSNDLINAKNKALNGGASRVFHDSSIEITSVETTGYTSGIYIGAMTNITDEGITKVNKKGYMIASFDVSLDSVTSFRAQLGTGNPITITSNGRYSVKSQDLSSATSSTWVALTLYGKENGTFTISNIMFSTDDDITYEKYGVSPSPDYPSKIETVKGIENLLDCSSLKTSVNGLTSVLNEDGSITTTGTPTANYITIVYQVITDLLEDGKSYTISQLNPSAKLFIQVNARKSDNTYTYYNSKSGNKTFTVDKSTYVFYSIAVQTDTIANSSDINITNYYQLKKGTTLHPFVPYGSRYLYNKITGKNVFNIEKYPFVKNVAYNSNGNKVNWSGYCGIDIYFPVEENTTYTFSSDINKSIYYGLVFYDKNINILSNIIGGIRTFTTPTNCSYIRFAVKSDILPTWVQIEIGDTATEYEPCKEKIITYDLKKENLFSSDLELGTLSASGVLASNSNGIRTKDFISIEPSTIYTLTNNNKYQNLLYFYDINKNFISTINSLYDITFTTPENAYFLMVRSSTGNVQNDLSTIYKLYEGTGSEDYYELASIGDIKDELDEVSGVLTKRIGKVVLNGRETWNKNASYERTYYTSTNSIKYMLDSNTNAFMSDYYTYCGAISSSASMSEIGIYMWWDGTTNLKRVNIKHSADLPLEEFKTWLSNNPVTVCYVLAEEETIQLEPTEIELFKGTNNIYTLDNLQPNMNITYLTDSKLNSQYATKSELKITEAGLNGKFDMVQQTNESQEEKIRELNIGIDGVSISITDIQKNIDSQQTDISNINSNINGANSEINNLKNELANVAETIKQMNYDFGTDELNINSTDDPVNTGISNKGMIVRSYETIKTVANDHGLGTDDLIVTNTAQIGYLKFMKSTDLNGNLVTDIHHLVSNIQDVADLVGDN